MQYSLKRIMTNRRYLRRLHFISRIRIGKWKVFRDEFVENPGFLRGGHAECHFVSLALKLPRFVKEFQSFKKGRRLERPPLKQLSVNNTYNHYGSRTQKETRLLKICSLVLMNARGVIPLYSRLVFEITHFDMTFI